MDSLIFIFILRKKNNNLADLALVCCSPRTCLLFWVGKLFWHVHPSRVKNMFLYRQPTPFYPSLKMMGDVMSLLWAFIHFGASCLYFPVLFEWCSPYPCLLFIFILLVCFPFRFLCCTVFGLTRFSSAAPFCCLIKPNPLFHPTLPLGVRLATVSLLFAPNLPGEEKTTKEYPTKISWKQKVKGNRLFSHINHIQHSLELKEHWFSSSKDLPDQTKNLGGLSASATAE